jgi:hypothetical protein
MTARERKQITLNLTDAEVELLEKLCSRKELSKSAVLRQALRLYQMVDERLSRSEKLFFEHEVTKERVQLMVL